MEVIKVENGCDINSFCPGIEEAALEQMKAMCRLPFVKYAALMPDAHMGQKAGLPIGGVVATDGVILPTGCGVDLGCGMAVIKTSLGKSDLEDRSLREDLLHSMERGIPVGFSHQSKKRTEEILSQYGDKIDFIIDKSKIEDVVGDHNPVGDYRKEFASQCGTLGGG